MRASCLFFCLVALAAWAQSTGAQATGKCAPGEFYKPFDDSCMACDPFCAGPCEDRVGCTSCVPGYYTSKQDPEWPNACKKCTIPNCLTCRSDIYDAWPMQCIQCVGGYIQGENRQSCVPIPGGTVASGILTKTPAQVTPKPEPVPVPVPVTRPQTVLPEPRPVPVPPMDMVLPPGYTMPQPRPQVLPERPVPTKVPVYTEPRPIVPTKVPVYTEPRPIVPTKVPVYTEPRPIVPTKVPVYTEPKPIEPRPIEPRPVVVPQSPQEPEPTPVVIPQAPQDPPPPPPPVFVPPRQPEPQPVVTPPRPQPEVSPETLNPGSCPAGSFVKKMDGSCMECDANCLPGNCGDNFGCSGCAEGYFTRAADPEWPFVCVLCDLPNCVKCIDNAFDAWPTLCAECAPGYELATSRTCVPAGAGGVGGITQQKSEPEPVPVTVSQSLPEPEPVEQPKPATRVDDISLTPGACPKGQFQKEHDGSCMECDKFCEPGSCVDHDGCNQCKPGYYRSRRDLFWPFLCIHCSTMVPGCDVCEDGGFDQLPVKCRQCTGGYSPSNDGYECVKTA